MAQKCFPTGYSMPMYLTAEVRRIALEEDRSASSLIQEAVREYLAKRLTSGSR